MKRKFIKSFQNRISFAFLVLSAVFVVITTLLAFIATHQIYRQQTGQRLAFEENQLHTSLQKFTTDTNNFINSIIIQLNSNQRFSLQQIATSKHQELQEMEYLMGVANKNLTLMPEISSVNILLSNGILYTAAEGQSLKFQTVGDGFLTAIDQLPITTKGGFYSFATVGYPADTQYYCKELRDIEVNQAVGVIFLEVKEETLRQYCLSDHSTSVMITNQEGQIITQSGELTMSSFLPSGQEGEVLDENGKRWMYVSKNISSVDWYITSFLNTQETILPVYGVLTVLIVSAMVVLIFMSVIAVILAKRLASPICKLSNHMVACTGTLPLPIETLVTDDEIDMLYRSFNSMLEQNQRLFENFKEEESRKQRLELELIQSQIKPHFLYNTLDTIYCLSGMKRSEEAAAVTKALADYYRLVLNSGQEWIELKQEWKALDKYLIIMQIRFPELKYSLTCRTELEHVNIPKLLLQPLVENSIQHGIRNKRNGGTLRIWADLAENDWISLCVADNGVGMTDDQFQSALQGIRKEEEVSFGLHSVMRRVQLFYGEASKMEMERMDEWTIVKILFRPGESTHV